MNCRHTSALCVALVVCLSCRGTADGGVTAETRPLATPSSQLDVATCAEPGCADGGTLGAGPGPGTTAPDAAPPYAFPDAAVLPHATPSPETYRACPDGDCARLAASESSLDAGALPSSESSDDDAGALHSPPSLGVYVGNDPAAVLQFETWLGRKTQGILGYTGSADWDDFDGSVGWAANLWSSLDRPVFWSVPLIPVNATLEAAARGDYDAHYEAAARALLNFRPQDSVLHVRPGWECNGDWFPWTAQPNPPAYVGAFRRFVTVFRSVSETRFDFEWNVSDGVTAMNPEDAYPGDDYVDIIGMDFYWNTKWESTDPLQAWNHKVTESWGLEWHQDFAHAHDKPTSYSEWGVGSDNARAYLEKANQWFLEHDVLFHTYWNSNSAFTGMLSNDQYPSAGTTYRELFGTP